MNKLSKYEKLLMSGGLLVLIYCAVLINIIGTQNEEQITKNGWVSFQEKKSANKYFTQVTSGKDKYELIYNSPLTYNSQVSFTINKEKLENFKVIKINTEDYSF